MRPIHIHQRDGRRVLGRLIDSAPAAGVVLHIEGYGLRSTDAAAYAIANASRRCEVLDAGGTLVARIEGVSLGDYWRSSAHGAYWRAAVRVLPSASPLEGESVPVVDVRGRGRDLDAVE
jgi:hypothetical protein